MHNYLIYLPTVQQWFCINLVLICLVYFKTTTLNNYICIKTWLIIPNVDKSLPKPSLKIGSVNKAVLFCYWQQPKNIFFRNKTFFLFQDRKLKLSASVWKMISWNLTKLQLIQLIQFLFSFCLSVVWLSWNFVRFHEIIFQTDAENFSILSWKTKKFYP